MYLYRRKIVTSAPETGDFVKIISFLAKNLVRCTCQYVEQGALSDVEQSVGDMKHDTRKQKKTTQQLSIWFKALFKAILSR